MNRLTIIDLDSILYIIAYKQYTQGNLSDTIAVETHVQQFIDTILEQTEAKYHALVFQAQNHINIRKQMFADYKANRAETPEFIKIWREPILTYYAKIGATPVFGIESDDALCIGMNTLKDKYDVVIAHADKDMYQVSGKHYNLRENKRRFISEQEALYNLSIQILMGKLLPM